MPRGAVRDPDEEASDEDEPKRQCAKCGQQEAGPGNVLCVECKQRIEEQCA
jgi:hypothetical protein